MVLLSVWFLNGSKEVENMYRVSIELYKHEWKFERTRNAVENSIPIQLQKLFN